MNLCHGSDPLCLASYLAMGMLSAGLILTVARLLKGPSTPDRVVALDLTAVLGGGIIAPSKRVLPIQAA